MSTPQDYEKELQNLLTALTDALLADPGADLERIAAVYHVPPQDIQALMGLIRQLHLTLTGVEPSKQFVIRLRQDILGKQGQRVFSSIRRLPTRVQIAAGVTVAAGFVLLARRRLGGDDQSEAADIPAFGQR